MMRNTKATLVILLAFMICFTPACIMVYLLNLCSQCSCVLVHWLRDMQFFFVILNSGVNPFVYAFRMKQFRRAFCSLARLSDSARVSSIANEQGPSDENRMCMEVLKTSRSTNSNSKIDGVPGERNEMDKNRPL